MVEKIDNLVMKSNADLVNAFAETMKNELTINESKGDWRDWKNVKEMIDELDYHLTKLDTAIGLGNKNLIKEHLADCGNFLLMIGNAYDLY